VAQRYEGKAKVVEETADGLVRVTFKDDATAGDGAMHDVFSGKGDLCSEISCLLFEYLAERGVDSHYVERSQKGFLARHVDIVPIEVVVRNLAADEGERRFQKVRRRSLQPFLEALAKKIDECQPELCAAGDVHPYAAAAALAAILERLAAYHKELEPLGVTRADLVENCARIMYQTVTGRAAPGRTVAQV